ncbi:hypothetical protein [Fontibacillus phaseoli]|nr:hypothetical protein [Fontibacillus phaseoli]
MQRLCFADGNGVPGSTPSIRRAYKLKIVLFCDNGGRSRVFESEWTL